MATAPRRGHVPWVAVVPLAYLACAVLAKLPIWMSPLDHFGGTADAEQAMWFLKWTPFALTHHHDSLASTYLNYPSGINVMWNTAMPALGVLLWPITAIWGSTVTFNVITTAAMALAAFLGFLAIRRYVASDPAAALGGLLFGFSPALIAQDFSHANVAISAVTIPLTLLLVDELLVRQRLRPGLLAAMVAALGVFQFFVFEEFFVTEVGVAVVVTIVLALMHRDEIAKRRPYAVKVLAVAVPVTVVLLAYPIYAQFTGPNVVRHSINDPNAFSTDLLNPILPTPTQLIAPSAATAVSTHFSGNGSEADAYIGIPLLLLLITAVIRFWRIEIVRLAGVTALIIAIFSLGPNLHVAGHQLPLPLPWWIPGHVPLIRSVIPARLMFFVFLAAGVIFAYALSRLWAARRSAALCALVAAIALVPLVPKLPLFTNSLSIPAFFTTDARLVIPAGTPVLTVPWPSVAAMDPMNWQDASDMRFRLLGGHFIGPVAGDQDTLRRVCSSFSGPVPPPETSPADRAEFLRQLHASSVGAVVVGPVPQRAAAVAFFTNLLGAAPREIDGVDVWILSGSTQ